jgi:hypothetical protein
MTPQTFRGYTVEQGEPGRFWVLVGPRGAVYGLMRNLSDPTGHLFAFNPSGSFIPEALRGSFEDEGGTIREV